MKKILLFVLSVMVCAVSFAQTEEKDEVTTSASKTLQFMKKDGSFIKRETIALPNAGPIKCEVLVLTDILNGSKLACMRLIVERYVSATYGTDTYIGTLDSDEIDAVIQCISHMIDSEFNTTPELYTEIAYKSRDGIQVGAYYSPSDKKAKWSPFVYTQKTTRSRVYPSVEALEQLKENCEKAIDAIKEVLN